VSVVVRTAATREARVVAEPQRNLVKGWETGKYLSLGMMAPAFCGDFVSGAQIDTPTGEMMGRREATGGLR
jgi:hypothetical protein